MEEASRGLLFVLSGFSGAGKGTIMKRFFEQYEGFALSVSATSRPIRPGETDGVHYHFVTRERFERMIADGDLVEYTEYQNNYYGTPRTFLQEMLDAGTDVFLEIEVDGGSQIRSLFPGAVLIFVTTPDAAELERRLRGRGTNTEEEIRGRMARALEETEFIPAYDYLLVNDDLDMCVRALYDITQTEKNYLKKTDEFRRDLAERLASWK